MLGIEVATIGAFPDFAGAVLQDLAHLVGHQDGQLILAFTQNAAGSVHQCGAFGIGGGAPRVKCLICRVNQLIHTGIVVGFVGGDGF